MEEYFSVLVKALESECERTRRAMAAGVAGTKRKVSRRRRSQGLKGPYKGPLPTPTIEEKPLIQPLSIPKKVSGYSDTLLWFVFTVLIGLLVLNAALYYKLWGLEQFERTASKPNQAMDIAHVDLTQSPQNEEQWRHLLQKQEQLHTAEVQRWLQILKAAVHLLQQVEQSLTALQSSIQSILKENNFPSREPVSAKVPSSSEL